MLIYFGLWGYETQIHEFGCLHVYKYILIFLNLIDEFLLTWNLKFNVFFENALVTKTHFYFDVSRSLSFEFIILMFYCMYIINMC